MNRRRVVAIGVVAVAIVVVLVLLRLGNAPDPASDTPSLDLDFTGLFWYFRRRLELSSD